jgi:hypothetical protein
MTAVSPFPANALDAAAPRIAALRADASEETQALMAAFAQEVAQSGYRVAGVVQGRGGEDVARREIVLRNLANHMLYSISQDLGPGSVACNLDTSELAQACAALERAARGGVDLLIVSKFAKQEAARGGLCDGFRAAIASRASIVTAVSPHYLDEWREFSGTLAEFTEPTLPALRAWWERVRAR